MNEFLVLLQAKLDEAKSKGLINSDITSLQTQLDKLKLQVEIDPNSAQKLANDIGKLINQKITISNINIDTNQAIRNAQQTGQQIGKQIQNGINSVIQKGNFTTEFTFSADKRNNVAKVAQKEFQEIANGIVTVKEQMTHVNGTSFLDGFIVNIKKANGEVESLTYRLKDMLDSQGKVTGKSFQYIGGSINDNGVLKQFDAISTKADNLQTKLDKLKTGYSDINSSRPIKDSNNISALSQQYDKVSQAIENVRNADNTTFSSMVSNAQREITALESMVAQFRNAENVATQMKSVDISSGIAQAQERLGKLKADSTGFEQMTQTLRELDTAITNVGDKSSLDAFIDKLRVAETQLSRVKAETKSMAQANKIQLSMGDGTYESKVDALVAKTMQWTDVNGNARISTNELSNAFDQLTTASNNYANSPTEAHQKALIASEKELDNQIKTVTNSVKSMNAELAKDSKISSLHNQLAGFMGKNGKAVKYFGNDLRDIFNQTGQGAKLTNQELAVLKQRFIDIQNMARNTGKLGKTWFQTLREGMSSFSYWTSSTFLVMKSIQKIKEAVTFSKELNSALVNINYTMDVTASQLENIGSKSIEMAKDLHTSAENVLGAVKLYANAKETADSILAKAQPAIMLSNVTGFSGEESAKYLQTIMNQFDLTQDNLMNISDTIQGISQSMAHDFADGIVQINEGIATSGEIARAAGMELADYASMIGLLVEKTGLGGSQLGNSLKTIITRTTKAGKIMGIDEGEISAAETSLRSIGVEVRKTDGEFNAFNDTMSELAKHWDSLSDVEKSNISFNLAGTRQINVIQTLLRNWDEYEDLVNKANNSTGVTFENQEKYAESLEGKLKELSATTTSIGDNIFKSDDLSVIVSGLTKIAGLFDTITSKTKLLGSIGLGAGIFAGVKNIGKNMRVHGFQIICFMF